MFHSGHVRYPLERRDKAISDSSDSDPASDPTKPLILTAKFDEGSQSRLDGLREQYFPPERNMIPAHLSLFNQLSPEIPGLIHDLQDACAGQDPIPGTFDGLRFLGKGVAYTLSVPRLNTFREHQKQRWKNWLEPQDLQRPSPHVTVQNKVDPQTARALHANLSSTFEPIETVVEGVSLWRYLDGPWQHLLDLNFHG